MKFFESTKQVQLSVHDDKGTPLAFGQVFINGIVATVYGLNGKHGLELMYSFLKDHDRFGVRQLSFFAEPYLAEKFVEALENAGFTLIHSDYFILDDKKFVSIFIGKE